VLIGGLQKTTLIDYPGKVACTIFTIGCNFACPFCHNKDLITEENFKKSSYSSITERDIWQFLKKRQGIIDGICITGGEPTLQPDLVDFIKSVKERGLMVKLDTNGGRTQVVKKLIEQKLVDFLAVDFKNDFDHYKAAIGRNYPIEKIKETFAMAMKGQSDRLAVQFRTTVVPKIHRPQNLLIMAKQLRQMAEDNNVAVDEIDWTWQGFRPGRCLDSAFDKVEPYGKIKMEKMIHPIKKVLPGAKNNF